MLCRKTDGGMCGHVPNEGSCSVIDVPHCKPCPITFALGALSTEVPQSPPPPQPRNPSCEAPICTGLLSTRTLGKHGVLRMGLASLPPPPPGFSLCSCGCLKTHCVDQARSACLCLPIAGLKACAAMSGSPCSLLHLLCSHMTHWELLCCWASYLQILHPWTSSPRL